MTSKPAPDGLGSQALKLWEEMTGLYEFRVDELRILEDACREVDLIERLEVELDGAPLMVKGSMKQDVANPHLAEVRQHRATLARLFKQLDLPDEPGGVERPGVGDRSSAARKAAEARWRRGA